MDQRPPHLNVDISERGCQIARSEQLTVGELKRSSSAEARALLPLEVATRLPALPLEIADQRGERLVTVAVPEGEGSALHRELRFAFGMVVRCVEVAPEILRQALVAAYHGDEDRLAREMKRLESGRRTTTSPPLQLRPNSGDAAHFLATLIEYAIAHRASDLHFVPRHDGVYIRLRVRGELRSNETPLCDLSVYGQMVARLKVLARLDTTRREIPQDGAFKVPREGIEPVSARLAIMPTIHGEKAVIRFLGVEDPSDLIRLNLSAAVLEELRVFMQRREGMALFAGPTGSGKSTTIYGVLQELAKGGRSVVSIEDPVERDIREISQTSIDEKLGLDFPTALRAILRQDPDVIALGEIRDAESARTAFHAALTGHLVVGTVHARRALDVPIRVGHLGVDPLTIAEALRLIVCQRLVPLLCRGCRVLDLVASNRAGVSLYREVGCDRCDYSGFSERRVVAEYIALDRKAAAVLAAHGRFAPEDLPKRSTSLEGELRALLLSGLISSRQFGAYVSD